MLVAILADIHANLEAFQAVLFDIKKKAPDAVLCLGDLIGYGPDPEEVVGLVRREGYISVIGNHEAALADRRLLLWFNFQARENARRTEELLSFASREFCRNLPRSLPYQGATFVHGFPPDSVLIYLSRKTDREIGSFLSKTTGDLFFVGHTHTLGIVGWDGVQLRRERLAEGIFRLRNGCKYIVNAGSVGQPRDGDNRAKYLLWDTGKSCIETVFVAYDHQTTARKIIDLGFPDDYALRLG